MEPPISFVNLPRTHKLVYALDDKSYEFLKNSLETFVQEAISKFVAGQREHGGFIADRPMLDELEKELIDAWMYMKAIPLRLRLLDSLYARAIKTKLSDNVEEHNTLIKDITKYKL